MSVADVLAGPVYTDVPTGAERVAALEAEIVRLHRRLKGAATRSGRLRREIAPVPEGAEDVINLIFDERWLWKVVLAQVLDAQHAHPDIHLGQSGANSIVKRIVAAIRIGVVNELRISATGHAP